MLFLCFQRKLSPGILAVVPPHQNITSYSPLLGTDKSIEDPGFSASSSVVSNLKQGLLASEWTNNSEHSI